jgi:hypothetical protein
MQPLTVYLLEVEGTTYYVKENAPSVPLLFIEYGPYGHFYHKDGFDWDNVLRNNLGEQMTKEYYQIFEAAKKDLINNPRPWEKDNTIKSYKISS